MNITLGIMIRGDKVNKPIEVIAIQDEIGNVRPYRFRLEMEDSEKITFQISRIIEKHEEKRMGINYLTFLCRVNHTSKDFELIFDKMNCQWYLRKVVG